MTNNMNNPAQPNRTNAAATGDLSVIKTIPTTYRNVSIALFALMILTIVAALFPMGAIGLVIAMLIAATKASLVAVYFMHLKSSTSLMRLFAAASLVWLAILIGLTISDYINRT
jgi:cytochrome c oxidase subunit 4